MPPFFTKLIRAKRTLRVHILALFLSLFILAFTCITVFTYSKNYKLIFSFSRVIAQEATDAVLSNFQSVAFASERFIQVSTAFLPVIGPLEFKNPILVSYLLNALRDDPHLSNLYIGFPNGSLIETIKIALTSDKNFITNPTQPLPEEVKFALHYVDRAKNPSKEYWHYLDHSFKELTSETLSPAASDATKRPWYEGAEKTKQLFWTGLYTFVPSLQKGISVAQSLFNKEGALVAVVGADLSFTLFSKFLSAQKIGKNGRAFIFDSRGHIIIPNDDLSHAESTRLGHLAFDQLISHAETAHLLLESQGIEYLSFSTRLHSIFSTDWIIIVVAPLRDFLRSIILTQHKALLFLIAILLVASFIVIYFSKKISSPITSLSEEIDKISQFDLSSQRRVNSTINEFSLLDQAIHTMRHVVQSFACYVPREVVKNLCQNHQEITLGGEKREVTIFFSNVSNFTSIVESQSIDVLVSLLSEYFDMMIKIPLSLNGTIDKFIGAGIMAFWGAPLYVQDHPSKACDAALLCQAELKQLNAKRKKENRPEFFTRFGIHTGMAIVGNIGTEDRMNYTIIGDAVNTAARLQEVDKIYHTSILISEDVYHKLGGDYIARPLDIVFVKGKVKTIKIYELLGKLDAEAHIAPTSEEVILCKLFTTAFEAMQQEQFLEAKGLFASIAAQFPKDFPTQIYLKRVSELLQPKNGN